MSDTYSIAISLSDATLTAINDRGLSLKAFKGVKTDTKGGASTVWLSTNNFSETVTISWEEQYGGYVDSQTFSSGIKVLASDVKPMNLGDLLVVDSAGVPDVSHNGTDGEIVVSNTASTERIGGMGQMVAGALSPLCAFPMDGNFSISMLPYEQVLFVFSSDQTDTGSVVESTNSSTIVITLTGEDAGTTKNISFDIDNGWDANNEGWAEIKDDGYKIADKLIHQTNTTHRK